MPIERKAWACQHGCGRNVLTSRKRMEAHEARCWRNPARRACASCKHLNEYDDDNGIGGTPYLQVWHVRECLADDGIDLSEKLRHDCRLWENATHDPLPKAAHECICQMAERIKALEASNATHDGRQGVTP